LKGKHPLRGLKIVLARRVDWSVSISKQRINSTQTCLVLSCFFRVHPLGGLFLAHAEAGLHCTVQSITPPWAGCSGLVHLNQSRGAQLNSIVPTSPPTPNATKQGGILECRSKCRWIRVGSSLPGMSSLLRVCESTCLGSPHSAVAPNVIW